MQASSLSADPNWPRAGQWITAARSGTSAEQPVEPHGLPTGEFALIGVPARLSSISPTHADATPPAVREALMRYSTFVGSRGVDVSDLSAIDLGDVEDPDGPGGEERIRNALADAGGRHGLVIVLGGDNSITYPVVAGLSAGRLGEYGLITIDAHHDVRDGETNGSPVRRLTEAGLPGGNIVQIGIADFSNSTAYARRARDLGIEVIHRAELRQIMPADAVARALDVAGRGGRPVFVDVDVDVCDRAAAPACPSAVPGGISADELRQLVHLLACDSRVVGMDIVEVDATADTADERTVRLAALLVLEAAAGLLVKKTRMV